MASTAVEIERAVHSLFSLDTQSKAYADKIRSLKYNLERNSELRLQLLQRDLLADALGKYSYTMWVKMMMLTMWVMLLCSPHGWFVVSLVTMKPEEMLTSAEKAKTDKQKQEFIESRQLDYWDEKADEVSKRLGLGVSTDCGRVYSWPWTLW